MPEINSTQINYQSDGVTKPIEELTQKVEEQKLPITETSEEEHDRKFQEIKDDIFRRRVKLMKRLAE